MHRIGALNVFQNNDFCAYDRCLGGALLRAKRSQCGSGVVSLPDQQRDEAVDVEVVDRSVAVDISRFARAERL